MGWAILNFRFTYQRRGRYFSNQGLIPWLVAHRTVKIEIATNWGT